MSITIDMSADEIDAIKKLTHLQNDGDAVRQAAREYIRLNANATATEPQPDRADAQINQWAQEMDAATAQIPAGEHDRFLHALDEIERESKEAVRKQWELP